MPYWPTSKKMHLPHSRRSLLPTFSLLILGCFTFGLSTIHASQPGNRLILIQVDGLPAAFFDAALQPASDRVDQLPDPALFESSYQFLRAAHHRDALYPNLRYYFSEMGCRTDPVFNGTLGVSAASWAVIQSGHPSIVKANSYFNRDSGRVVFYLDAFDETLKTLLKQSQRTAPVWELDLLGIQLLEDAFEPERRWTSIQILYRQVPGTQLSDLGKLVIKGGKDEDDLIKIIQTHLGGFAHRVDYPEQNDVAVLKTALTKLLQTDEKGNEINDFISVYFPNLDHQFHVDADYRRTLEYMVKLDNWVGEIMNAVERSKRRDQTIVVLLSDHGSDFSVQKLNRSFPLNQWLRREEFGGHTILSPYTEHVASAISRPVPGLDKPKVYESPDSPYGPGVPFGEEGYVTAFTNHQGNARVEAFFRNSDLNELHLILLRALQFVKAGREVAGLYPLFSAARERVYGWLEGEIHGLEKSEHVLRDLSDRYGGKPEAGAKDSAARLTLEAEEAGRVLGILKEMAKLPGREDEFREWAQRGFEISKIIPKGYLGPKNTLGQLKKYVVGWRSGGENGEDSSGFSRMNYFRFLLNYEARNPNSFGERSPFDFIAVEVPIGTMIPASTLALKQAVAVLTRDGRGDALILESSGGTLAYRPVDAVECGNDAFCTRESEGGDPFSYRQAVPDDRWLTAEDWARETGRSKYSIAPVVLADLFRDNFKNRLDTPSFEAMYSKLGIRDVESVREALAFRYRQSKPDFRAWLRRGWNANPNTVTPSGSHGGFNPLETEIVFSVWGGPQTGVQRGRIIEGPYFSWEIAPTLLDACGIESDLEYPRSSRRIPIIRR